MFKKGYTPWNKGLKIGWNKGTHIQSNTGITHFKRGCVSLMKGKHHSEETKIKLSKFRKEMGLTPPKKYWFKVRNGKSLLRKIIKENFKYRQWRLAVFKRDNYTCQKCGIRGGIKCPHHIKGFSKILKDNNIKTIKEAIDCKELWDINNGQTLCHKCHKKTNNYGRKEFLNL